MTKIFQLTFRYNDGKLKSIDLIESDSLADLIFQFKFAIEQLELKLAEDELINIHEKNYDTPIT